MKQPPRRWTSVIIFFFFMLLHQSDKLLIGSLTDQIMETFQITKAQMGAVSTGALLVGAFLYPLWGYLYDRFARPKLLALASLIWGATTWLNAIAPTYPAFLSSRATTGIDDSSYPGLYSLISDYFEPKTRGKIYGFLQLAMPLGFLVGMVLALTLGASLGWRRIFYLTGALGVILSIFIFRFVRDAPRGQGEPEMQDIECIQKYRFNWKTARGLFRKPSLVLLFVQGFFGVFPWNVITYWFIYYLQTERGLQDNQGMLMLTMGLAVIILAAGYPIGGALGDWMFKRTPRGRITVAGIGVITGAVLLLITMFVPISNPWLFLVMLCLTALFIPFASPNVLSTVYDVTEPEVRSTAVSVQYFIESFGAAMAPRLGGLLADNSSMRTSILLICISAWVVCALSFVLVGRLIPQDIARLRGEMRERAEKEKALQEAV